MAHPVPRPLPRLGGFSSPSTELRDHAIRLREHLELVYRALLAEHGGSPGTSSSMWDVKMYATAVTVFAAAAMEAALNSYGLMRFGAEQFEKHFAHSGPVRRLQDLLKYARDLALDDDDPLVEAVRRLGKRRNAVVHPRAYESTVGEEGTFRSPETAWESPTKITDADESISDMDEFFTCFPSLDPETASFLRPWPIRHQ